ncbi:hypothetical protein LMH87_006186 [Akanthomyces muscarius]|uniref:Yeast cell wall synthesis Kre9/Knh1-like N-terminal domain-containing protein n=1 Tax=Akanthomyces muscarius TaxID=2231603 RepID=A0A9W8USX2_AKAMU|nr:hypothetical protein LMH87_006186 [Akanthomyces muscarius]KAJ4164514.1 hypothetical protein LMH87_006186 [Akanthomyces muscarius]
MRFSLAALGLFCAAASATTEATGDFDSIFKPEKDQIVKAGSTVDVAWSIKNKDLYGDVKVDIQVYAGKDDKSLVLKDTVATKIDNSDLKYKWNVDSALGSEKTYGLRIQLSSNETVYQWSNHFTIKNEGGSGGSTTGSSTASSTESATSSSSSTKTMTSAATTSASTSTSKSEHTTTAPSSASATSATTPTTNGTTTAVSTVTKSPTPSQGAAAGLTARAGVAGAVVGCVALMAF